jgi:hypothetical protein
MKKILNYIVLSIIITSCSYRYNKLLVYNDLMKLEVNLISKDKYYISHVYGENFGDDGIKPLIEVIDKKTFIKVNDTLFKDKNYKYALKLMYDSATLRIVSSSSPAVQTVP